MSEPIDLLRLIADDKSQISYRPRWNSFTGRITATILLQQIIYRWVQKGRQPFYKFSRPCNHEAYRPGDSWEEELGMSRREFEGARNKIAVRSHGELKPDALVSYWTDRYHKTWYALNEPLVVAELIKIYPPDEPGSVGIQASLPMYKTYIRDGDSHHKNHLVSERTVTIFDPANPFPSEETAILPLTGQLPLTPSNQAGDVQNVHRSNRSEPAGEGADAVRADVQNEQSPLYKSASADAQNDHQPMHKSAIGTDAQNGHSPMDKTCSGKQQREPETTNKENEQREAAANRDASAAVGPHTTPDLLAHIGIVGRPAGWYRQRPAAIVLAWYWSTQLEAMQTPFIPGYIVNQLKAKTEPPAHLHDLAKTWLTLDPTDRETLRAHADAHLDSAQLPFADQLPESLLPDLYAESLNAFYRLYQLDAHLIDW